MSKPIRSFRLSDDEYRAVKKFIEDLRSGIVEYKTQEKRFVVEIKEVKQSVIPTNPLKF